MARQMADDYQETFRARVESRAKKRNPDPTAYGMVPDPDAPVSVSYYGPYARASTAKAAGRASVHGYWYEVLRVTVQRAEIQWKDVD